MSQFDTNWHFYVPINQKEVPVDHNNKQGKTLEDILAAIQEADLPPFQRRDITSAIKRICEMAGVAPVCRSSGLEGGARQNPSCRASPKACRCHRSRHAGVCPAGPGLGSPGPSHCR
jgi:hypothetical protein